jgi:hypothetical protein
MNNLNNELLPFLNIIDVASIVNNYLRPLSPCSGIIKRFKKRLQGAIKRIILKDINKNAVKNNKVKINIEIYNMQGKLLEQ